MHPDWVRSIRDQCQAAGVAFFLKQWGSWKPMADTTVPSHFVCENGHYDRVTDDRLTKHVDGDQCSASIVGINRVGKKAAGRMLDGREWNEMPAQQTEATCQ